ncbi:hypothetical protein NDA18_003684 [Ustilago nuda]|nr:hypothetical protein NDA18_003684 [Ustilago nuda]
MSLRPPSNRQGPAQAPMAGFGVIFVSLCLIFSIIPLATVLPNYKSTLPWASTNDGQASLDVRRREDLHMRQEVCRMEFPRFYPQLAANEIAWKKKGGIGYHHVQSAASSCRHGCVHVLIKHGQVFIRQQAKDWQSRVRSVLQLLTDAYKGASEEERSMMEGIELVISTADFDGFTDPIGSQGAGWVLDKKVNETDGQYLFPDFSFASWPEAGIASYPEFRRAAEQVNAETPWRSKANKAFWRGDALLNSAIQARNSLLSVATGPGTEEWSDVKRTSFWEQGPGIDKIVSASEHCRHRFLIHSEGVAYSGRSKFILGCQSTVITHELEWEQHFHPALISSPSSPDQNHIQLPGTYFENLAQTMQNLIREEIDAEGAVLSRMATTGEKIAKNAKRTLTDRYLTPAATACYVRAALMSYGRMMDSRSWPGGQAAELREGGGVKPGAGTDKATLKDLGVKGDVEYGVWCNLGQPEWPPQ